MTPRRQVHRAISEIEKVAPEERPWIWIYLMSGQKPPIDELKFERDTRIRRYRAKWHPDKSERAAAAIIAREANHYRAGAWREHQHLASKPSEMHGTARGDLFEIMKFGDVPAAAMIKTILRGG